MTLVNENQYLRSALEHRKDAIFAHLMSSLNELYPDRAILEIGDSSFYVGEFAKEGHCEFADAEDFEQYWTWYTDPKSESLVPADFLNAYEIRWEGSAFRLLRVTTSGEYCRETKNVLIAEDEDAAHRFVKTVVAWNEEIRGEILVFDYGHWQKSEQLFEAIQTTRLDSLILKPGLKETILSDFGQFFQLRSRYEEFGLPWKRGVLLLGPPGNGKTHAIKGLINALGRPCLYVRNLRMHHGHSVHALDLVFTQARKTAPCVLVFEDLDALIDDSNRSYFLNQMDGFHENTGILTVATTNHPEKLDPAILDRPSRFDRKYHFELPGHAERAAFMASVNVGLDDRLRLSAEAIDRTAAATEGFSFAYLKELYRSALMEWISEKSDQPLEALMVGFTASLLEQMRSSHERMAAQRPVSVDEDEY